MSSNIKFSPHPGAYERHLQRKYQNPLFATSQQALLDHELEQAQQKDQQDLRAFMESFEATVQEAADLSGSVESDVMLDLKERLERLYVHSTSLAGDLGQFSEALLKLIDVCMSGIRNGAQDDPMALKKIQEEIMARKVYFNLLNTPLVADLMRGDEIIQAEELIPSILSEPESNLPNVMELFESEHQQHILAGAKQLVNSLEQHTAAQFENRLAMLEALAKNAAATD